MPGRYLAPPVPDGAAQPVDLGRQALILELEGVFGDGHSAEFGVGYVIDASQGLVGVPGVAYLAVGVACFKQAPQLGAALVADALVC